MKIRTSAEHIQNSIVSFPIVGEQQITDGIIDIQDDVAQLLLKGDDWHEIEEEKEVVEEDAKPDEVIDELTDMPIEELLEIAKEGGVKKYQLFKDKPAVLRTLIRKALDSKK